MTTPEAARHDLYTGLVGVLGEERAQTLMAHLPTPQSSELATKSDIAELRAGTRSDTVELRSDFAELRDEIAVLSTRMDDRLHKLTLTLVAGLFVIVGAMAGVVTASLL